MQLPDGTLEYWDRVYRACMPEDMSYLMLNFYKRPQMFKRLLDYDFFDKAVLDIGCGIAIVAGLMHTLHGGRWEYVGIDPCEYACKATAELFNLKAHVGSAESLPCKDGALDYIWAFDVLEHVVPENLGIVAKEFDRCLKVNGSRAMINNPLCQGVHDPKYDHDLGMDGIALFAKNANLVIERLDTYGAKGRSYQFIVLGRARPGTIGSRTPGVDIGGIASEWEPEKAKNGG